MGLKKSASNARVLAKKYHPVSVVLLRKNKPSIYVKAHKAILSKQNNWSFTDEPIASFQHQCQSE